VARVSLLVHPTPARSGVSGIGPDDTDRKIPEKINADFIKIFRIIR